MPAAEPLQDQATDRLTSTEFVRLLIAPVVVTLLFAGGVYWIRLQPPAGSGSHEQVSMIQVHLIPHQDSVPIPTASASQAPDGIADRTEPSRDVAAGSPGCRCAGTERGPVAGGVVIPGPEHGKGRAQQCRDSIPASAAASHRAIPALSRGRPAKPPARDRPDVFFPAS